jgi:hypothetical protein
LQKNKLQNSLLNTHVCYFTNSHHHTHKLTHAHPSAQARPIHIRRDCTWLRGIRSLSGFAHDGHVILTIVAHPRVRQLKILGNYCSLVGKSHVRAYSNRDRQPPHQRTCHPSYGSVPACMLLAYLIPV